MSARECARAFGYRIAEGLFEVLVCIFRHAARRLLAHFVPSFPTAASEIWLAPSVLTRL